MGPRGQGTAHDELEGVVPSQLPATEKKRVERDKLIESVGLGIGGLGGWGRASAGDPSNGRGEGLDLRREVASDARDLWGRT